MIYIYTHIIEGSLEVKLPTIWTDGKAEVGRVREEKKKEAQRRERVRRKKMYIGARHCVFPKICGSGGLKSRLAKAAGAEPSGEMREEKLHAVVARSTFPSQNVQNTPTPEHFWKLRCSKVHAVVARSTFPSKNVQNTPCPDHFWKLRCRKSARRCGAKHMSKSKCTKYTTFVRLLDVHDTTTTTKATATTTTSTTTALHHTMLHYTTPRYTKTTLTTTVYTTLHYTTSHYSALIKRHYATPHHIALHKATTTTSTNANKWGYITLR